MFQDDRMIPVLTAMVLMVVVGTFLQRVDAVDRWLGGNPQPDVVLRDDMVAAPAGALLHIDVLGNDDGIGPEARSGLSIVTQPPCGRLSVQDGMLEYLPGSDCNGRQTIRYSVPGVSTQRVGTVTVHIRELRQPVARIDVRATEPAPVAPASGQDAAQGAGEALSPEQGSAGPAGIAAAPDIAVLTAAAALAGADKIPAAAFQPIPGDTPSPPDRVAPARVFAAPLWVAERTPADIAAPGGPPDPTWDQSLSVLSAEAGFDAGPPPVAVVEWPAEAEPAPAGRRPSARSRWPEVALADPSLPEAGRRRGSGGGADSPERPGTWPPPGIAGKRRVPERATAAAPEIGANAPAGGRDPIPDTAPEEPPTTVASLSHAGAPAETQTSAPAGPEPAIPELRLAMLALPPEDELAAPEPATPSGAALGVWKLPARPSAGGGDPPAAASVPPHGPAPSPVAAERARAALSALQIADEVLEAATGPTYVLAAIGGYPTGTGAADAGAGRTDPSADAGDRAEIRIASLPPLDTPAPASGPALAVRPVLETLIIPRPRPARAPAAEPDPAVETAALDPAGAVGEPVSAQAVRRAPAKPCVAAPAMTLDLRGAGETVMLVEAPCGAATVAELAYSGLRLAVPLDALGRGGVTVLGFEPNSPAVLTFADGTTLEFDLPFRGVERVSRVAIAWEAPVELALNAREPGAAGDVGPAAPRSFEEVRRTGGGWLSAWAPLAGTGQHVQVYSWYHRSGEAPGVVKMLVEFVSRDRDRLASACGNGPDAAPRFTVLRSEGGRPERAVTRQIAPLDCRQVAGQGHDSRLISGAVDDLVIISR